jgi:amino acid transporter
LGKLMVLVVLTSAVATLQASVLHVARSLMSMARHGAIATRFADIHPRHRTPAFATVATGAVCALILVPMVAFNPSLHVLFDAITGVGFLIAFYYALTGFACVIYYRRQLTRSARHMLYLGGAPLLGAVMFTLIFVKAAHDYSRSGTALSQPILGIQTPVFIGVGSLVVGAVVMLAHALTPKLRPFFRTGPETAQIDGLSDQTSLPPADPQLATAATTVSID